MLRNLKDLQSKQTDELLGLLKLGLKTLNTNENESIFDSIDEILGQRVNTEMSDYQFAMLMVTIAEHNQYCEYGNEVCMDLCLIAGEEFLL